MRRPSLNSCQNWMTTRSMTRSSRSSLRRRTTRSNSATTTQPCSPGPVSLQTAACGAGRSGPAARFGAPRVGACDGLTRTGSGCGGGRWPDRRGADSRPPGGVARRYAMGCFPRRQRQPPAPSARPPTRHRRAAVAAFRAGQTPRHVRRGQQVVRPTDATARRAAGCGCWLPVGLADQRQDAAVWGSHPSGTRLRPSLPRSWPRSPAVARVAERRDACPPSARPRSQTDSAPLASGPAHPETDSTSRLARPRAALPRAGRVHAGLLRPRLLRAVRTGSDPHGVRANRAGVARHCSRSV